MVTTAGRAVVPVSDQGLDARPADVAIRPDGRPGYVIDHIKPLACGGADAPSSMQWQTAAAAKAKDRIERVGCP